MNKWKVKEPQIIGHYLRLFVLVHANSFLAIKRALLCQRHIQSGSSYEMLASHILQSGFTQAMTVSRADLRDLSLKGKVFWDIYAKTVFLS